MVFNDLEVGMIYTMLSTHDYNELPQRTRDKFAAVLNGGAKDVTSPLAGQLIPYTTFKDGDYVRLEKVHELLKAKYIGGSDE